MKKITIGELPLYRAAAPHVRDNLILVDGQDGAKNASVGIGVYNTGQSSEFPVHATEEEVMIYLKGEGKMRREDGTEVKRIFLPVYGIDEVDNLAISTYQKEGYEVHPMPLANLATRKGALRCMSQWLQREQHLEKFE